MPAIGVKSDRLPRTIVRPFIDIPEEILLQVNPHFGPFWRYNDISVTLPFEAFDFQLANAACNRFFPQERFQKRFVGC